MRYCQERGHSLRYRIKFLSSNTQDFIEVGTSIQSRETHRSEFLSSNTQDFIEVGRSRLATASCRIFLSSNTQDFIEVVSMNHDTSTRVKIPEL